MISFEPLVWTMKKNKVTGIELSRKTGITNIAISNIINGKTVPCTDLVEKICRATGWSIDDVIAWKKGKVVKEKRVHIKWDMVKCTPAEISIAISKSRNTVYSSIRNGNSVKMSDAEKIAYAAGVSVEEIIDEV